MELAIDGDQYSPAVIERITVAGGACNSFSIASKLIQLLMDVKVSPRTVNNKTKLYREDAEAGWEMCLKWIELCWKGDVLEVIGQLEAEQLELGQPAEEAAEDDPQLKLKEMIIYLQNNVSRMDYPSYRQQGLPTSSCLIESQVKEMNHRIKGSEKFWDDGEGGEAINHVRAALISDGERLHDHISSRPGDQYTRPTRKTRQPAMT
ncbi:MAG: hypothetical protein KDA71_03555 [Planctomycetales bacterium]|nr:hypothetical protein [Planctomycetales bacterium]